MEQEKRYCKFCDSVEITRKNAQFCSQKCSDKQRRIDSGKKFIEFDKKCEWCGTIFTAQRKNSKYCCAQCMTLSNSRRQAKKKNDAIRLKYTDLPECKICGYLARALHSHIKYSHSMSVNDYKLQFNCDDSALYHESYVNELSERIIGESNPAYDHGGKFSPFSEKFIKYEGLDSNIVEEKISSLVDIAETSRKQNNSHNTHIEYYIKKGLTEDEAKDQLSSRQTTFSLEKCIEKFGDTEGRLVWQDRQDKWQKTLLDKSPEEIMEINKRKIVSISNGFSMIANKMISQILQYYPDGDHIYYADKHNDKKEKLLRFDERWYKVDFCDEERKKIIEFYGDYWHGNPKKFNVIDVQIFSGKTYRQIREADAMRENIIRQLGYNILIIWESDYKKYPKETVQKCLDFLNS